MKHDKISALDIMVMATALDHWNRRCANDLMACLTFFMNQKPFADSNFDRNPSLVLDQRTGFIKSAHFVALLLLRCHCKSQKEGHLDLW